MIIVEGPDGAGKSTFVQQLAEHLQMPIAEKAVGHQMERLTDIQRYVETTLREGFQPKIFDRFALISGCIYGPVFSMDGTNVEFKNFDWLESAQTELLERVDPVIVWCLPPLKEVIHNITHSPENAFLAKAKGIEKVRQVYWLYHCRASIDSIPIMYDYTSDDIKRVFMDVETELERRDGNQ